MRKDLTELVFIIDRSGSMSGLESDTIGGFNSMIRKQKQVCTPRRCTRTHHVCNHDRWNGKCQPVLQQ